MVERMGGGEAEDGREDGRMGRRSEERSGGRMGGRGGKEGSGEGGEREGVHLSGSREVRRLDGWVRGREDVKGRMRGRMGGKCTAAASWRIVGGREGGTWREDVRERWGGGRDDGMMG